MEVDVPAAGVGPSAPVIKTEEGARESMASSSGDGAPEEGGGEGGGEDGAAPQRGPLKKNVSAFLHFCSEQREAVKGEKAGMNVGEVTKALSEKWRALDDAGKQKYVDIAAADKERYEREKKDAPEPAPKKPTAPIDPYETVIPVARVKKICKLDPDVKSVSKEATAVISKAAELFIAQLARETHLAASGKKMIRASDVANCVHERPNFAFLRVDYPSGEYAPKPPPSKAKPPPTKPENQPGISQFFAPVRKSPDPAAAPQTDAQTRPDAADDMETSEGGGDVAPAADDDAEDDAPAESSEP